MLKTKSWLRFSVLMLFVGTVGVQRTQALAQNSGPAATKKPAIEELTITATKRKEDIQQVPIAVSAFSGATLENLGVVNVAELSKLIPGLQITQSNNNRNTTVLIRGIGSSGTNPGIEPSVGIFVDGVFLPAAGPIQGNLLDIGSIETLRGPQGTLYGRNTPVGAINITTRAPTGEREGMVVAGVGNYGEQHVSGFFGDAITDNLAGRISLFESSHDGYQKNLYDNTRVNDQSQYGGRARLTWTPTDNITDNFIGYYSHIFQHCCTGEQIDPTGPGGIATPGFLAAAALTGHPFIKFATKNNTVDDETVGKDQTQVYGVSNQLDVTGFGGHTLTSITAFNGYDDNIKVLAADGLPQNVGTGPQTLLTKGYSEEIRIASPKGQMIDWIGGVYLFREKLGYLAGLTSGPDANRNFGAAGRIGPGQSSLYLYNQTTTSEAVFGQATWNITQSLRATGGLRWSNEEKKANTVATVSANAGPAFRASFPANPIAYLNHSEDKVTWSVGVQYDIAERVMAYALQATGFKSGGFNARQTAPGTPLEFGPENSRTYELGLKSSFFERSVVFNVDVYELVMKGFQQSTLNPTTGIGFIVGNAGNTRTQGIEFDAQWRPIAPLTLTMGAAFNKAKYYDYGSGQCATYPGVVANGVRPGTCSYNGLRPAYNPSAAGSVSADWRQPLASTGLEGFISATATYTGKQIEDGNLDPRAIQRAYTLVNARLGVDGTGGRWRLALYAKNLTGETYYVATAAQPLGGLISGGGTVGAAGYFGWVGAPRLFGIEGTIRF